MTQLFTARVRTGLAAAVMVAISPVIVFAQTTESAIEGEPAAVSVEEAKANPTGEEDSLEVQSLRNELRRELLDDRAASIDRWLFVLAIALTTAGLVLAFFSIVAVVAGYIGFRRFQEIETEAKRYVEEIKRNRDESDEMLRSMSAETADSEEAKQAVANVRKNPEASLIDKVIADAISLQQQGRIDDAIEKWRAIAQVVEGSDNDRAASAWFSVGYLLRDEDPEKSISFYDRAIRLNPDYSEVYNNRGIVKASLGRYEDAVADFGEAIRLKPEHIRAYNNRGNARAVLGRHKDAIADFDEAIRLKSDYTEAYYNRGIAKAALGQYKDAIADCDETIRLNPDLDVAYNNRGIAKAALGQYEDAIIDYDQAIHLNLDYAGAYNNRGAAKAALGRHEDAIADFDEAVRLKPDYTEAYRNRGNTKVELGRYTEAIADYDETIRLSPDYAKAYINRGNTKGMLGRHDEAITDFDEAIRLKPDYTEAYTGRGVAKVVLGRRDEAREDFKIAHELAQNAGNEDLAATVEKLLRELDEDESP